MRRGRWGAIVVLWDMGGVSGLSWEAGRGKRKGKGGGAGKGIRGNKHPTAAAPTPRQ